MKMQKLEESISGSENDIKEMNLLIKENSKSKQKTQSIQEI